MLTAVTDTERREQVLECFIQNPFQTTLQKVKNDWSLVGPSQNVFLRTSCT